MTDHPIQTPERLEWLIAHLPDIVHIRLNGSKIVGNFEEISNDEGLLELRANVVNGDGQPHRYRFWWNGAVQVEALEDPGEPDTISDQATPSREQPQAEDSDEPEAKEQPAPNKPISEWSDAELAAYKAKLAGEMAEEREAERQAQITKKEKEKRQRNERLQRLIVALQSLTPADYELRRNQIADEFGVRVAFLDKFFEEVRDSAGRARKQARSVVPADEGTNAETAPDSSTSARNLTELGNAERFIDICGADVRYDHTARHWLVYDGRRFAPDETARVNFMVKTVLRQIYAEAQRGETAEEREAIAKWAIRSEQARIHEAVLRLVPSDPKIAVSAADLDRDQWALNLNNGTLDLRTLELRPHRREDLVTMLAPVDFDPDASCPLWDRFIEEILPNPEVREYVQTLSGYCLAGDTSASSFPIAYGGGQNGKSTQWNTLREMLGDYAGEVSPEVLMAPRFADAGKSATPELAGTKGKRLILASESVAGARLNDALVKLYTGGERIVARFLHGNPFSFSPTAKIVLFTNHKPQIPATDLGIWRRVRLIPYSVTIPDDHKDEALREKLRNEWPGILNWCLTGLERYIEKGLQAPEAIERATRGYRASEDVLAFFLAESCDVIEGAKARSSLLFERYREWCAKANERSMTARAFKNAIDERGYQADRDGKGVFFHGLALRVQTDSDDLEGLAE